VDFADPAAVLAALNHAFPMERQHNMFFTIWYGVFSTDTRELSFACGGHPPAVVLDPVEPSPVLLSAPGAIIGGFPEAEYSGGKRTLPPGSRLFVFSDGVYELARPDGSTAQLEEFVDQLSTLRAVPTLDGIVQWAADIRAGAKFEDDVSLVEVRVL
jgi:sigma-B regulation protein RsbU (phosphoserine phosphatase)